MRELNLSEIERMRERPQLLLVRERELACSRSQSRPVAQTHSESSARTDTHRRAGASSTRLCDDCVNAATQSCATALCRCVHALPVRVCVRVRVPHKLKTACVCVCACASTNGCLCLPQQPRRQQRRLRVRGGGCDDAR